MTESDDDDFSVVIDSNGRIAGSSTATIIDDFRLWNHFIQADDIQSFRAECHRAAWPLASGSFWLPADASPTNPLEELAAKIFQFHTAGAKPAVDHSTSGAEWWANVSRGAAIASHGDINLHFDKDEAAYSDYGLIVHPLLSTITYLSDEGAATLVLPHIILNAADRSEYTRSEAAGSEVASALLVPPSTGRHVCFDGRWLHGAPAGYHVRQSTADADYCRITFCVNIWVGHKPGRCARFPVSSPPTTPLRAPQLRLRAARSAAAAREAKASAPLEVDAERARVCSHALPLEQTATRHELLLPSTKTIGAIYSADHLHSTRAAAAAAGASVLLRGDGIQIRKRSEPEPEDEPANGKKRKRAR